MKRETLLRTNGYFTACSRNHTFCEAASNSERTNVMDLLSLRGGAGTRGRFRGPILDQKQSVVTIGCVLRFSGRAKGMPTAEGRGPARVTSRAARAASATRHRAALRFPGAR